MWIVLSTILLLEHCGWNTLELWRLSAIKQVSLWFFLYLIKVSPAFVIVFHYLRLVLLCGGGKIFKGQVNGTHLLHGIDRYFLGEVTKSLMWFDQTVLSEVVVFNPFNTVFVPGLKAVISFKPGGWFSGTDDLHTVEGFIIDKSVELVYLKGMFTSLKIQFWN